MPPPAAAAVAAPPLKIDSAAVNLKLSVEARKPSRAEDAPATEEAPFEQALKRARSKPEKSATDAASNDQQAAKKLSGPDALNDARSSKAPQQVDQDDESQEAAEEPRADVREYDSEPRQATDPASVALTLVPKQLAADDSAPGDQVSQDEVTSTSTDAAKPTGPVPTVRSAAAADVAAPQETAAPWDEPNEPVAQRSSATPVDLDQAPEAILQPETTDTEAPPATPAPQRRAGDAPAGRDASKLQTDPLKSAEGSSDSLEWSDDQPGGQSPLKQSSQPKPFDSDERQDTSGFRTVAASGETPDAAAKSVSSSPAATSESSPAESLGASLGKTVAPAASESSQPAPAPVPTTPLTPRELGFAQANHERLVTAIRAQLLPRGGTMQILLDPPQLGALQVAVEMLDGVMNVSFQTSNQEATRLLSHSLAQLKHALESHGVSVEKLHVQQAPKSESSSSSNRSDDENHQQRHDPHDETFARHEQQRKEMLRRMWRRLALGSDPLDLVA